MLSIDDFQEKVQSEQNKILKGKYDFPSMDDLNKMIYMECVIKESLRMWPVVPFIGRAIKNDYTLYCKF